MIIRMFFFLLFFTKAFCETSLAEQFNSIGYREIHDEERPATTFDALYASFDAFIAFIQADPAWLQKLYGAKERFIRSNERNTYSADFFGLYDESKREGRGQIAFYYSTHFHQFICSRYPEFNQIPEIIDFFNACLEIQKPCGKVFTKAAEELGIETLFSSKPPPVLLKVIKYLPSYSITRPHYDGSAFSLFLDSTDNQSLLLSPYKDSYARDDFFSPHRQVPHSILLIPGALLTEFSVYPTPHIVLKSGKIRYSTVAFAMRPNYTPGKIVLSPLPNIEH